METPSTSRNLLLGLLALQMEFIDRQQLTAATRVWLQDKSRLLAEILVDQGVLSVSDLRLLEPLVERHIENHGNDPTMSLAALSSVGSVANDLKELGDSEIAATMSVLGRDQQQDSIDPTVVREISADGLTATGVGLTSSAGTRFRILRPHARGGLGEVSVAQDNELNREVALKEIQPRFADDRGSRSRFLLEAEVTGGLEHPGIVPVYGLGQYADGRPFYAMRFIKGDSLQEAADRFHAKGGDEHQGDFAGVEFRKLLGRFIDVCQAIEYAHSRGVLHRDLKPGNIMLGNYGETLVVDWGLAKTQASEGGPSAAAESPLPSASAAGSVQTVLGSAIGTPAFMPPEQASGQLDELGPASDVYSLGATLYYLLTGRAPFAGKEVQEVLQAVQAGDFPTPCSIRTQVPKPLDAICLKAMSLRPADRYASPQQLADDVERYLADDPVGAHRESLVLRARRWMRKHPAIVTATIATLLVGLSSAIVISSVVAGKNHELAEKNLQLDDANGELHAANALLVAARDSERLAKDDAITRQKEAETVLDFFQDKVLAAARPAGQDGGLGVDATIREAVDAAEPQIAAAFASQPLVEASIRSTLGLTYQTLGESKLATGQHALARKLRLEVLGPEALASLRSGNNLGMAYLDAGQVENALQLLEEMAELMQNTVGADDSLTLTCMNNLALAYSRSGQIKKSIALLESTVAAHKRSGAGDAAALNSMSNLAAAYQDAGMLDKALPLLEESLPLRKSTLGLTHPETIGHMNNLAQAYRALGQLDKALPLQEEVLALATAQLGPRHLSVAIARSNLGGIYAIVGQYDKALPLIEEAFEVVKEKLGTNHPSTLTYMQNIAACYLHMNRNDEAITLLEETRQLLEAKAGPDHPVTLACQKNLGTGYQQAGRYADALPLLEHAYSRMKETLGPDHPSTLSCMSSLGDCYRAAGQIDMALPLLEETLTLRKAICGFDHPETMESVVLLFQVYMQADRRNDGTALLQTFVSDAREELGDESRRLPAILSGVGLLLSERQLHSDAEPILRECLERLAQQTADHWLVASTKSMLGQALAGQQRFAEAEPLLIEGYRGLKDHEPDIPATRRGVVVKSLQRLVQFYTAWEKPESAATWQAELQKMQGRAQDSATQKQPR